MKRKIMMMSFAMLAGLPHAVFAKGSGKQGAMQTYSTWDSAYTPHYGIEGTVHPLLDHLSGPVAKDAPRNNWQLALVPPHIQAAETDNPLLGGGKKLGFSLKLQF
jgi:hypothetical protein